MTTARVTNSRLGSFVLVAMLIAVAALCERGVQSQESQKSARGARPENHRLTIPQYNDKGELKLPADFQTWVFVGANLGLEYRDAATKAAAPEKEGPKNAKPRNFHNVYINPEAYEHYAKTGTYPDQ